MRRIIREVEPPRPSLRLSTTSGDERTVLAKARHIEPGKLNKAVEPDLDWIVMKAIEKDRTRRYETANGFALDIQRFLASEPVSARSPSVGYRFRKFARRNKMGLSAAVAVATTLQSLPSAAIPSISAKRPNGHHETRSGSATAPIGRRERRSPSAISRRNTNTVRTWWKRGAALTKVARCLRRRSSRSIGLKQSGRDLRGWEWYYHHAQLNGERLRVQAHRDGVFSIAVSGDGSRIATAGGDGDIAVWESRGVAPIFRLSAHHGPAYAVSWHAGGRYLASGGADGFVRVWDVVEQKQIAEARIESGNAVRAVGLETGTFGTADSRCRRH